jgi:hypothetical protein
MKPIRRFTMSLKEYLALERLKKSRKKRLRKNYLIIIKNYKI